MNQNKPLISIVIPAYKTKEELLRRAIDNIIGQTFERWELLVINDGSDKNVRNIIFSYKNKISINKENISNIGNSKNSNLPVIKYFETRKSHGGPAYGRNIGLKNSCGKYIFFHDHDDFLYSEGYTKNALENICKEISDENLDMLIFKVARNINNKTKIGGPIIKNENISQKNYAAFFNTGVFSIWNKVIKRKIITDNNITFNTKLCMLDDLEFFTKLICLQKKIKIKVSEKCYYYYYSEPSSLLNSQYEKIVKDLKIIKTLVETLSKAGYYNECKYSICNLILELFIIDSLHFCNDKKYISLLKKYIKYLNLTETDIKELDIKAKKKYLWLYKT